MLAVGVLGPLHVTVDGVPVEVPKGKASQLLTRLALEAGQLVSADRLVEDLWASASSQVRRNTLQSKVAMLRRALGPGLVVSSAGGYALNVEADAVDALTLLRAATSAARHRQSGEPDQAVELCNMVLPLLRGVPFQEVGDAAWAEVPRTRIGEAHVTLVEVWCWARIELGDAAGVIGHLEEALADHPFHEGLWELLITALYRTGRQADALAAYQRVRARLAEELGLDPSPALTRLERDVLAQEVPLASPGMAVLESRRPTGNLPSLSAALVGRETDLAALVELVSRERLVVLTGPGGVGKTAVALEVGRRLAASGVVDEAWLARLENAVTPAGVIDVLVAALHGPGSEDALFERLQGSSALVILDNCEHVVAAATELAVRLLDHCPSLRVLCTSQLSLQVGGERIVELEPLALADAVELFALRATRLAETAQESDRMVDLCRSLDGLPLAIELAAARTRTLTVQEISRRLDDRFSVLSDPNSRRSERRRSLRSTIGWSYDLLFPDDQRGLWALAAFAGGAPLPAVESVLDSLGVPSAAALDVVDRLVHRSLVTLDDDPANEGAVRYRVLESIRAFALEALADAGETQLVMDAHAGWYAVAAAASTSGVRGADQAEYLRFARVERSNIDAALAWSAVHDPFRALRIASGFGWAWVVLGDSRGAERLLFALAAAGGLDDRERGTALLLAGWIEASTGHLDPAREHIDAAIALAEQNGDLDLQARGTYYLAYVVSHHGEFGEAWALTERSRELYARLDRPWDQAANALFAARAAISAGDEERGDAAVAEVERWLKVVDDPWLRVRGEAVKGELARLQRRFRDAVAHLAAAAETSRTLGFLQTEAYQLSSLGRAWCQDGDYLSGVATLRTAIEKAEATGDLRLAALVRVHLGRTLRAEGDLAGAREALESAVDWHRRGGGGEQALLGECLLAAMDAADGIPGTRERLLDLLTLARAEGAPHVEVFALDALAALATGSGHDAEALVLVETADLRMTVASHFITEHDRVDAHRARHGARPSAR